MTKDILKEHRLICERYQYLDKYKLTGRLKKIYFRVRRAFWYYKRGGIANLVKRLIRAYVTKHQIY
jgi:hypothetical protein